MLLKYNTSLVKVTNNLVKMEDKPPFARLSYFNNYANLTDTPLYGESYNIRINNTGYSSKLIKNSMNINGITYPTLRLNNNYYHTDIICNMDMPILFDSWSSLSIDYWCRLYMSGCWCEPFNPFSLDSRFWADNWGGDRGAGVTVNRYKSYSFNYINSNLRTYEADGWRMYINSSINNNTIFHLAYVFIKKENNIIEQNIYVNGILQTSINKQATEFTRNDFNFYTSYDYSCYIEMAQLAIREGDYSINNKQNFPVPTEPYAQW